MYVAATLLFLSSLEAAWRVPLPRTGMMVAVAQASSTQSSGVWGSTLMLICTDYFSFYIRALVVDELIDVGTPPCTLGSFRVVY
jgi:hypothetical protein